MTPAQIYNLALKRYNAVGDDFFGQDEMLDLIFEAQMELALEARCIRKVFTTPSVVDQQEYTTPSTLLGIYRASYDGTKLNVVSVDEVLSQSEGIAAGSGTSTDIGHWGSTLYLAPIPATAGLTIKTWCYAEPQTVTISSSLEVPSRHQFKIVTFLLAQMALKDNNERSYDRYMGKWENLLEKANQQERLFEKTGGFTHVVNEDFRTGVE